MVKTSFFWLVDIIYTHFLLVNLYLLLIGQLILTFLIGQFNLLLTSDWLIQNNIDFWLVDPGSESQEPAGWWHDWLQLHLPLHPLHHVHQTKHSESSGIRTLQSSQQTGRFLFCQEIWNSFHPNLTKFQFFFVQAGSMWQPDPNKYKWWTTWRVHQTISQRTTGKFSE